MRIIHKKQTDQEYYENLIINYKENTDVPFINPDKWKDKRLRELEKEGKNWSY